VTHSGIVTARVASFCAVRLQDVCKPDGAALSCANCSGPSLRAEVREHPFVTSQGSAFTRFRRALDHKNVTEALSAASELEHLGLAEALQLCLLPRDKAPERYPRAAFRLHGRLCREVDVSLEEAQAILAALVLMACERTGNAAFALADLRSQRGLERPCETLVAWARRE
jgi:hypothetical protein